MSDFIKKLVPVMQSSYLIAEPFEVVDFKDTKRFGHVSGGAFRNEGTNSVVINGAQTLAAGEHMFINVQYPYIDKSSYALQFLDDHAEDVDGINKVSLIVYKIVEDAGC